MCITWFYLLNLENKIYYRYLIHTALMTFYLPTTHHQLKIAAPWANKYTIYCAKSQPTMTNFNVNHRRNKTNQFLCHLMWFPWPVFCSCTSIAHTQKNVALCRGSKVNKINGDYLTKWYVNGFWFLMWSKVIVVLCRGEREFFFVSVSFNFKCLDDVIVRMQHPLSF